MRQDFKEEDLNLLENDWKPLRVTDFPLFDKDKSGWTLESKYNIGKKKA